jgi:predicted metal-dependent hydrolase
MIKEKRYVTGETLNVFGKKYNLVVNHGDKTFIELTEDTLIFSVRDKSTFLEREFIIREWQRYLLTREINVLLPKWEGITSLKSSGWIIQNMKTRWGTCNTRTKKIRLNLLLVEKDKICLEYVILHELVHLLERGHNQRFYSFMDRYMHNWREIRKELNENG